MAVLPSSRKHYAGSTTCILRLEILMPPTSPFLVLNKPCDKAVAWAVQLLEQNGLHPVQTFDLQTARLAHADCPCPHHGTAHCTCQMVVLLVYQGDNLPATMTIHGNTEASWFYIVNTPQQPIGQQVEKHIEDVLNFATDATIQPQTKRLFTS